MKKISFLQASLALALLFTFASCKKNDDKSISQPAQQQELTKDMMLEKGLNPDEITIQTMAGNTTTPLSRQSDDDDGHYLYTESNSAGKNEILVYEIKSNGNLMLKGMTASGGAGTGKPLGSQGALVLDEEHEWLYAVNAGGNSVSSFKVHGNGSLSLAHTEGTMGGTPVSVSVHDNMLYVLNRASDNIHGFHIGAGGTLTHINGSSKSLSGTGVDAPQISFTPDGDWIVVTEKATNTVSTFKVKNDGSVGPGIFTPSVGKTPFGFEFSRGRYMIVSNAVGGAPGAGSATSYITGNNGKPTTVNGAIPNFEAAPCWVAITKYGSFAYITNTASDNISSHYVAPWGGLYLVHAEAAKTGMGPLDIVVAANNYYVYALNAKSNTISGFYRKLFGELQFISNASALPAAATGLATF